MDTPNKVRNEEFVRHIIRSYNAGKLIRESDWKFLLEMAHTMDRFEKRSNWLQNEAKKDNFLGQDIEQFVVLTQSYNKLLKTMLNIEEFLKYETNEEDCIIKDNEEAKACITRCFEDILSIKSDNEEYLTGNFK